MSNSITKLSATLQELQIIWCHLSALLIRMAGNQKETLTSRPQGPEGALCVLIEHASPTAQELSSYSWKKETFGVAWLVFQCIKTRRVDLPLANLDLSSFSLSASRLKRLLFSLPSGPDFLETFKCGAHVCKDASLSVLRSFFQRLEGGGSGGGLPVCLKTMDLSDCDLSFDHDKDGAVAFFASIPKSLEELNLNRNFLGIDGVWGLAEKVKVGGTSSLRSLCMREMGLTDEDLELLCSVMKEKSLGVEKLDLSENEVGVVGVDHLCSVLCVDCLPRIRELQMSGCGLDCESMRRIAEVLKGGKLPNLELLDLSWNEGAEVLKAFGEALHAESVPRLTHLRLGTDPGEGSEDGVGVFLDALAVPNPPPALKHVELCVSRGEENHLHNLGKGRYPAVRQLTLTLGVQGLTEFLRGVVDSESAEPSTLETLDMHLEYFRQEEPVEEMGNAWLSALAAAVRMGRLSCLQVLDTYFGERHGMPFFPLVVLPPLAGGITTFLTSLSQSRLPNLSYLSLKFLEVTDAHMVLLADAVRAGNLPVLEELDLTGSFMADERVGRVGMEALMNGVIESEQGLPFLKTIHVEFTRAGEGVASLARALVSGKLSSLSCIHLEGSSLNSEGVGGLTEAVRAGCLSGATGLFWGFTRMVAEEEWEKLFVAIQDSERGLPVLESFDLAATNLRGAAVSLAAALVSGKLGGGLGFGRGSTLTYLDLSQCEMTDAGIERLGEAVRVGGVLSRVSYLGLSRNRNVRVGAWAGFLQAIADSEAGLPRIRRLCIVAENTVVRAGESLVAALASGKLPLLRSLHRDRGPPGAPDEPPPLVLFDADGVIALGAAVRGGQLPVHLERQFFFLDNGPWGDVPVDVDPLLRGLAESESGLPSCLAVLDLSKGRMSEDALASLREGVGGSFNKLANLEQLVLTYCEIDDARLKRLGEILCVHGCPKLFNLDLSGNRISPDGLAVFIESGALSRRSVPKLWTVSLIRQQGNSSGGSSDFASVIHRGRSEEKILETIEFETS
uniref:Uncharacterized protein n=1 Tax=Chromera velia CCMP2878 TaxID=1169474 RepID=A0A0G4HSV4_9ALVE|eukprot:Cvel_31200.t1-p1 / transcript=Cvel_31200.t1 / gene=Cvel_31200 / organism=Chromera_velia_CCMP2878 / gene_product=Leucine-rich repeat-containing protein LOC400891, putative / transcript_product=Leucine-rich repeat-containing protein LOC400891, putative / location=Cvel_scaffold4605:3411-8163(-) / protein_length=1013 / sequence_SO=supercontig / SO=protein_coding / is_pseudo=false